MLFFFNFFAILTIIPLFAMEKPAGGRMLPLLEERNNWLRVLNDSPDKIEIGYRRGREGKLRKRTLMKKQYLDIPKFSELGEFVVMPYGKIKGQLTTRAWEPKGLWLPPFEIIQNGRFVGKIQIPLKNYRYQNAQLFIKAAGRTYDYELMSPVVFQPVTYQSLADAFPQVKNAIELRLKLEPRYFLSVGKDTTLTEIEYAKDDMENLWAQRIMSDDRELKRYAIDVYRFIEDAYQALKGGKQAVETFATRAAQVFKVPKKYYVTFVPTAHIELVPKDLILLLMPLLMDAQTIREAIRNVKAFLLVKKSFARYLSDPKLALAIINVLAHTFNESPGIVALKLNTTGARIWLGHNLDAFKNDPDFIFELIKHYPRSLIKPLINSFILQGGSLDVKDADDNTPLMKAIESFDAETANFLIDHNAAIFIPNKKGLNAKTLTEQLMRDLRTEPETETTRKKLAALMELQKRLAEQRLAFRFISEYEPQ